MHFNYFYLAWLFFFLILNFSLPIGILRRIISSINLNQIYFVPSFSFIRILTQFQPENVKWIHKRLFMSSNTDGILNISFDLSLPYLIKINNCFLKKTQFLLLCEKLNEIKCFFDMCILRASETERKFRKIPVIVSKRVCVLHN